MPRIIGVFGGTFDPVHNGHVLTISELLEKLPFEKILVIPNLQPPHRESSQVSYKHRYEMASLAFKDIPKTEVDSREYLREGPSYAIKTVKEVMSEEEGARVVMIVGSDSFVDIHSWYKWKELINMVDFVILKRPDRPLSKNKKAQNLVSSEWFKKDLFEDGQLNIFEIEVTPLKISSSSIRENIAKGKKIDHLVNTLVEEYIKEHGLYGTESFT